MLVVSDPQEGCHLSCSITSLVVPRVLGVAMAQEWQNIKQACASQHALMAPLCAGACNAQGQLVNTEDKDCEQCKADLYLFSVISHAEEGRVVCPEHAALLKGPLKLLYRQAPLSCSGPRGTG